MLALSFQIDEELWTVHLPPNRYVYKMSLGIGNTASRMMGLVPAFWMVIKGFYQGLFNLFQVVDAGRLVDGAQIVSPMPGLPL
jgi:hypothetical protein